MAAMPSSIPRNFKESIIVIKSKSGTMKPIVSASLAEFTDVFTITACPIVNSWVPSFTSMIFSFDSDALQ